MAKIHNSGPNGNRMPLILTKELAVKWLNSELTDEELKTIIDFEFPAEQLVVWPVDTIRTRKEDDDNVIKEMKYPGFELTDL